MYSKLPEPRKDELTPHDEHRKKLLQDHFIEDPDLSKRYVIIEHNLDVIENLEKLLRTVTELSSEGIEKESLDEKDKIFNRIRETIKKDSQTD